MVNETAYDKPEETSPPKRATAHRKTVEQLDLVRELLVAIKKGHPDSALAIDAALTALLAAAIAHGDEARARQVTVRDVLADAEQAVDEACELLADVRLADTFDDATEGLDNAALAPVLDQHLALFKRATTVLFFARNIRGHARDLLATDGAK